MKYLEIIRFGKLSADHRDDKFMTTEGLREYLDRYEFKYRGAIGMPEIRIPIDNAYEYIIDRVTDNDYAIVGRDVENVFFPDVKMDWEIFSIERVFDGYIIDNERSEEG